MAEIKWMIRGPAFNNCNCAYGCPCQFNAPPTHGNCQAVVGIAIEEGYHGDTRLDGLRIAGAYAWPGAIHEGRGEAAVIVDERASAAQRSALFRILAGKDTEPGATIFHVFSTTLETIHPPVFTTIELAVDIDNRRAHLKVPGLIDAVGEPIRNPVTGEEHRARIDLPDGFEYRIAEMGRGWSRVSGPIKLDLQDSHAHFAELHLCQSGLVR